MFFADKLDLITKTNNSLLCVGLDSDINTLPKHFLSRKQPQFEFNKAIIEATHDLVCAYKPNSAFYEARGAQGIEELRMTVDYLRTHYPDIVIILDAKRADIGSSNEAYVAFVFEYLTVDAVTLHPYLGREAVQPFLDKKEKGIIILCHTSNEGAGEFQDLFLKKGNTLHEEVARAVTQEWNEHNNCLLVVGGTYPSLIGKIREIAGDMTFLVPGIGAQGGEIEKIMEAGLCSHGAGMIINSSRGVIFADTSNDFAKKARDEAITLRDTINSYRTIKT